MAAEDMTIDQALDIARYPYDAGRHDTFVALQVLAQAYKGEHAQVDLASRQRSHYADRFMAITTKLAPLCLCGLGGASPEQQQDCPIHGDVVTFVAEVLALRKVVEATRVYFAVEYGPLRETRAARKALDAAFDALGGA